ncbi:MAG TPA: phosphoglucosamine mutase [Gammaproteobacteria bacterium]|jgi:phosphoglucosamine mutase|nr:phosphoglucosamine mutase [Gammaproteobacteria bacterium]
MSRKYFGTDGVRGRVGTEPMTAASVLKLGWAAGKVLANQGNKEVLIGKDTRISGYLFESALEAGLSSAGIDSRMLGPMPTPAVAYLTRTFRAAAGIVISASHNPYFDNGLKFFSSDGSKLPDDTELEIEAMMDEPLTTVDSAELGRASRVNDAAGRYIEFCKSTYPSGSRLNGLKLVVDSANGAAYDIARRVFEELGAEVIAVGNEPNGLNINLDCGATAPDNLRAHVLLERADIGVALDGDGDRLIMVDHRGEIVDGDQILYILAKARHDAGELPGGVVGTLMSNLGLEHALQAMNIEFDRAAVGDRYVLEKLNDKAWTLGGESSGHIICLDRTTTGDAIVAALQVLAYMRQSGETLSALKSGMTRYPQVLLNVPLSKRVDINANPAVRDAVGKAEGKLGDSGRVLLRPSGTEPVVRVMVEGKVANDVEKICNEVATAVGAALG